MTPIPPATSGNELKTRTSTSVAGGRVSEPARRVCEQQSDHARYIEGHRHLGAVNALGVRSRDAV